ncbi:MAG: TonB-dependent receptor [Chitinophagaceae bacterium]|nr:TonB-dependent receptor [Chitinophagaceae bacterium]
MITKSGGKFVRNILPNGRYDYVRAKRFNDAYRSVGGLVEAGFTDVKWADHFLIGYNVSDDYNEIQHGTYMSIPYKGRFTEAQAHVISLNYRKRDFLTNGLEFTFNGMYSMRNEVVTDTVRWNYNWFGEKSLGLSGEPILRPGGAQQGAPTINHIDRKITTFRSGLNYDIGSNHKIIFNHIYYKIDREEQDMMRSAIEREFIGTRDLLKNISSIAWESKAFGSRFRSSLFGKYYQQQIERMNPLLRNENGQMVKYEEHTDSKKTATGYGLALSYAVSSKLMILTSAERAVRLPSESEVFGSPGDNITENMGINPEVSNNINLGIKTGPFLFDKHRITVSVNGFIRDTRDKIVQRINPRLNDAVQTNPYENLGKTKSIGFESEIKYAYDNNLQVNINFSKFNSVFNLKEDQNGRPYEYYNQQLPNEPWFTVNSSVQYTLRNLLQKESALTVYYNLGFVERFYTTWLVIEDFRTPRQLIQDLGVSYLFPNKKFVISADARNIFDQQAYDNFAVQKPGRAFYLKLNYTLNNF